MFRSNPGWLGFAVGAETVRVAQLTRTGATFGVCHLAAQPIRRDAEEDDESGSLARALERLRQRHPSWPRRVAAALPASRVVMTRIELPPMSDVELAAAAGWEAERQLDIDQDEFRIDCCALTDDSADSRPVLVAAVRKDYADACSAAFRRTGFELTVLDAAAAALHNVYAANYSAPNALLVDADDDALTIHVVDESLPRLTRTVTGIQAAETARAIDAALSESGVSPAGPVFLSGAAFRDSKRVAVLSERLSMTVEALNPMRRIPPVGSLTTDPASASEFAVAIGAALRLAKS